jgi:peptide/nickel transport system substrate-binding protein
LRNGVLFQDQESLSAEAVKISLERAMQAPRTKDLLSSIKEVRAQGNLEVQILLEHPFAPFLSYLAMPWASVISPKALRDGVDISTHSSGTGPFILKQYEGARLELSRNDSFWGERPDLNGVVFRVERDPAARTLALFTRTVDVALDFPSDALDLLRGKTGFLGFVSPHATSVWLELNVRNKELADRRVRLAIAHALSRSSIPGVKQGLLRPAYGGILPPELLGSLDSVVLKFDPVLATRYLAEMPLTKPLQFQLLTSRQLLDVAKEISSQLSSVGIKVEVIALEPDTYLSLVRAGKADMWLRSWTYQSDPGSAFRQAFTTYGLVNYAAYKNSDFDVLTARADSVLDQTEMATLLAKSQELLVRKDVVIVPLLHFNSIYGARSDVSGFNLNPFGLFNLSAVRIR